MNGFPLAPFLCALKSDGIDVGLRDYLCITAVLKADGPWSMAQLKYVLQALLIKDKDLYLLFSKRFEAFFSLAENAVIAVEDIDRALAELQSLSAPQNRGWVRGFKHRRGILPAISAPEQTFWDDFVGVGYGLAAWLLCVYLVLQFALPQPVIVGPISDASQRPAVSEVLAKKPLPEDFLPVDEVVITHRQAIGPIRSDWVWQKWLWVTAVFTLVLIGYLAYLRHACRIPKPTAPPCKAEKKRLFSLRSLGGKVAPLLSGRFLDHFADALGYVQSDVHSHVIHVDYSIQQTVDQGGVPAVVFQRQRQVRRVVILEDRFSQATWNSAARELACGLITRGISVVQGYFENNPGVFTTSEGQQRYIEDFEDQRRACVFLYFSDSQSLASEHAFVLERLSRWPNVAWMELRERARWDSATTWVEGFLSVYEADEAGLSQALTQFAAETPQVVKRVLPMRPFYGRKALAKNVAHSLGDALRWVQACAMMQPMPLGLADRVRQAFFSTLPAHRVQRMLSLPGTVVNAGGMCFSRPVLAVLRKGFARRWIASEQQRLLRFLLMQLQQAEPSEDHDAIAYLTWRWHCDRIQLQITPDVALASLCALAAVPEMQPMIAVDLQNTVLPDDPRAQVGDDWVPLLTAPTTPLGFQRLGRLAGHSRINILSAFPLSRVQMLVMGSCMATLPVAMLAALYAYTAMRDISTVLQVATDRVTTVVLETRVAGRWQTAGALTQTRKGILPVQLGRVYRLIVDGQYPVALPLEPFDADFSVTLEHRPKPLPCMQTLVPGLRVQRCAQAGSKRLSWRQMWRTFTTQLPPVEAAQRSYRSLVVAFTPDAREQASLSLVKEHVLANRSIDAWYELAQGERMQAGLVALRQELLAGPKAQILFLMDASQLPPAFVDTYNRAVYVSVADPAGMKALVQTLVYSPEFPIVPESSLLALPGSKAAGAGMALVFFHPEVVVATTSAGLEKQIAQAIGDAKTIHAGAYLEEYAKTFGKTPVYQQQYSDWLPLYAALSDNFKAAMKGKMFSDLLATHVSFSGSGLSDLKPLASLSQLQRLNLRNTQVSDLKPLASLSQLQTLFLSGTDVSDLKLLASLSQLQGLDLAFTQVSDLKPLASLSQLQRLQLGSTQVSDLKPLASLSQLQSLGLKNTQVSDLKPLASLSQLQTLYLDFTQVSDLKPLASLSQLQTLFLSGTDVSDLKLLASLSQLQGLDLAFTQVSDLKPLASLSQLQTIYLDFTQVSDLKPLASLSQLQSLGLKSTQVRDLKSLASLSQLQWLDLRETQVSDLKPLHVLHALKKLQFSKQQQKRLSKQITALKAAIPVRIRE